MSWQDLLNEGSDRVLPWCGSRRIHDAERTWTLSGNLPPEHGWYKFELTGGRKALLKVRHPMEINPDWAMGQPKLAGYLVGDRLIPDGARVDPDPDKLVQETRPVFCLERGLERFARAWAAIDREGHPVYMGQEFPLGPEPEVIKAFQDRAERIDNIAGVTPALDLAFRWLSDQRLRHEERQRELQRLREEEERKRAAEERLQQAMRQAGTAVGRRALAAQDFEAAAREALRVSGAELLDVRDSYNRGEKVVQYRFQQRRFECVVDNNMRVVDAGICLTDHGTGEKGDTFFTLESLPGVVGEAINLDKLVVWRHVDADEVNW